MIIDNNSVTIDYVNLFSLTEKQIGIPIFQRFYDWKENHVEQLKKDFDEIILSPSKQLYLLDFIYYDLNGKYMMADGQQRLISITLLVRAINDCITENEYSLPLLQQFNVKYEIEKFQEKYEGTLNNYVSAPFKKVYLSFRKWIDKMDFNCVNLLHRAIRNNVFVFLKKCSSEEDAFNTFQQINTGGKPLTKDEIIRTAILQYANSYGIHVDDKIKDMKQAVLSYYKYYTKDTNSDLDTIQIITFLRENITKDYQSFDRFVRALNAMKKLQSHAITYVFEYIGRKTLNDVTNVLAMKGIELDENRIYLEKIVIPLCMMSVVLSATSGLPSKLKEEINKVISQINDDIDPSTISMNIASDINSHPELFKIDYEEFVAYLAGDKKNSNLKKGLLVLDVIISNTSGNVLIKKINLEHIYPQRPSPDWTYQGWPTDPDEKKIIRDNIGNMFLLCESVNKSISNKYLSLKIPQYNQIIQRDALLRTRLNTVDFTKFMSNKFDYIKERQRKIAELIYLNFPFGQVVIKNHIDS